MRVEGLPGNFGETPPKEKVDQKKRSAGAGKPSGVSDPSFVEELKAAVLEEVPEDADFTKLIADVDESGRELLKKQDGEHLKKYKEAVKRFLLSAVKRTYRLKVVEGRGPSPKLYVYVEKIESKLDELTRTVLAAQKNPLQLLSQLEELRGLLLDMKM